MRWATSWLTRYAPLLLAAGILLVAVGFGTRGQGPLGQVDAIRSFGGLGPVTAEGSDEPSATGPATNEVNGASPPTTRRLAVEDREPGTCIVFDPNLAPAVENNAESVPCDEPHILELTAAFDVDPAAYGPDGPTADEWTSLIETECLPRTEEYLGQSVDLVGRYVVSQVRPSTGGWRIGDHAVLCAIGLRDETTGAPSTALALTGSVIGTDQAVTLPIGTCTVNDPTAGLRVVGCDAPHDAEVVALVDVIELGDPYPSVDAILAAVQPECSAAVARVYGAPPPPDVRYGTLGIHESSWAAGRRSIECTIGVASGTAWATVTGPVRVAGGWTVV